MLSTVQAYIAQHQLLRPAAPVIVGLSGGADSVALLHILTQLGYPCVAAHCNFHLRNDESDADADFAQQTTEALGLPFRRIDFDTADYAHQNGVSTEMAARTLRYEWFETLRRELGAEAIAVAHHRDDNVETVLLNLIRGTGLSGLCGMRPRNGHIVRPLLSVDRHQIVRWLADRHLPFRTDSSNASDVYRRNFVRLRLLPLMEQLNPSVRDAILRMAGHLTDVEAIYRDAIDSHRAHLIDADGRISIDALLRTPAPQAVLFELLTPYGFTPSQCADIARALNGESGRSFVAPGGRWHLLKDRLHLILYPADEVSADTFTLTLGSELTAPIHLSLEERIVDEAFTISRSPHVATFDADRIALPLTIRRWRAGDSFVPFGMTGRKKLSDYFSDHKFSLLRKAAAWILCDASGRILWIVGHRTDNRFRITSKTRRALIVTQR